MLAATLIALILMAACVLVNYEALRLTQSLIPRLRIRPHSRILLILFAVFTVHLCCIALYAGCYYVMSETLGLGTLHGEFRGEALDYLYFSATNYTTLGIGDVFAHGPIRLVAGTEPLTGLVLIAWSASFTYLHMERFWELHQKQ